MHRKILNIQALRGVAALMVVLPHLKHYDEKFGGDLLPGTLAVHAISPEHNGVDNFWGLGHAGVDLFFVISGFVMVATTLGRRGASAAPGNFLVRRAARIYPLYWAISLVVLVVYLKNSAIVNSHDAGLKMEFWKSFLLFPQKASPLVAQGWTLIHELYFYLVFALLLACREAWAPVILIAWGVIVTAISFPLSQRSPELNIIANPLTLEFIAGCFVAFATQGGEWWMVSSGWRFGPSTAVDKPQAIIGQSRRRLRGEWAILIGITLLIVCGIHITDLNSAWQRVGGFGVASALIVFGAVTVERAGKTAPRWLIATGDASYSLYLTHGLVLAALARWAWEKRHIPTGHLANPLVAVLMAALAIAFAFACYCFLELPLTGLTKKWLASSKPSVMRESAPTAETTIVTSTA